MARNALLVYANTRPWSAAEDSLEAWLEIASFPEPLRRQVADWGEQREEYQTVVYPKPQMVTSMAARLVQLNEQHTSDRHQSYAYGTAHNFPDGVACTRVAVLFVVPPREPFGPALSREPMAMSDWAQAVRAAFPEMWSRIASMILSALKAQGDNCRAAAEHDKQTAGRGRSSAALSTAHARLQALRRELGKCQEWEATSAASGAKPITRWNMSQCAGNVPETDIVAPDVCTQICKFPEWLGLACDERVGLGRLRPGSPYRPADWVKAVTAIWHGMKVDLLLGHVFDANIPKDRVLRGMIDPDERDVFWVVTSQRVAEWSAAGKAAAETATGRDDDTLKQHAAWICPLDVLRTVLEQDEDRRSEPAEIFARAWSRGFLHVLRSAPRGKWARWRIRLGKEAEFTGAAVMIVFAFIGQLENIYTTFRRVIKNADEGCWPSKPFFELLSLPPPQSQRTSVLAALTMRQNIEDLPLVVREVLDSEQLRVLDAIAQSRQTLHFLEALAGTGKSVLGRAVVLSFVRNGPQDQLLLYISGSRDLRDDVVLSMTSLEPAGAAAPPKVVVDTREQP